MSVRPPTIKDVALAAEVSFKTVARVLNNEPGVREALKVRVQAAVEKLGYTPNISARGLSGAGSRMIVLISNAPPEPFRQNYDYMATVQAAVVRACRLHGYHVAIEVAPDGAGLAKAIDAARALAPEGVLVIPPICDNPALLDAIVRGEVAAVRIAPTIQTDLGWSVRMDDKAAAVAMTRHLLDLGHTDIAFIEGHPGHGASVLRLEGFRQAMAEAGLGGKALRVESGNFTFASGRAAGLRLLARAEQRPTAIFAANDLTALGVIGAAAELGLKPPEDVSVAGFDDTNAARMVWPDLTSIRQPLEGFAEAAVELVIAGGKGETERWIGFELMARGSTAPPRRAPV
ncbi:LacI family DNA-binding transcriptional regulator [Caulobacter sp. RL271]|jgi:LacI family transcriptional regulator|uniref:LacI family DNA-binding transcriptional regulator n=1 Tax=Caulobacter segnis TaxID=88688 RepID=A0ABY4ZZK7_9CAUL|nr:LacI family DNA-binding transcriptional regulator [Caulobacter segnis]USQ98235.1 LacI family DNA-binding transcriptional regulator [Caulobacter segnis]